MKKLFINRMALLCAILLLAAENMQAETRTVTTETFDANTPGSLPYEIKQLKDGDVLTFDREQVDTITLNASLGSINYSVTILGNGVTICTATTASVTLKGLNTQVENVHFEVGLIVSAQSSYSDKSMSTRFINCTFKPSATGTAIMTHTNGAYGIKASLSFEGCAFLTKGDEMAYFTPLTMNYINDDTSSNISFTSCTFICTAKNRKTFISHSKNSVSNQHVTFTNCVLLDPGATSDSPSVKVYNIHSKGYNVFQGVMQLYRNPLSTWEGQEVSDYVVDLAATEEELPLTFDEGIYKVTSGQKAYRHLPSNAKNTIDGLADINFPEKDLSGQTIDYVGSNTHSGAWQTVYGDDSGGGEDVMVTDIKVNFPDNNILFTDTTYRLTAAVLPGGTEQEVTWECTTQGVTITPSETSKVDASFRAEGITEDTPITMKVTAKGKGEDGNPFVKEYSLTLKPYTHVTTVALTDLAVTFGYENGLRATVLPANANWKELEWTVSDPAVASITVHPGTDSITVKGLTAGITTLTATAKDNTQQAKATAVITVSRADYSDGVFIVNEDWFGHGPSSVNFLYNDGRIDYNAFKHANPSYSLGTTTQYGAIYGGKFYLLSKQGVRLVVADACTMELQKGFFAMGGDGRSFLGVDEHTGYAGTSNGVRIVDLDALPNVPGDHVENASNPDPKLVVVLPGQDIASIQSGSGISSGQMATMKRVGERIFAIQQGVLHVITATNHQVETTLDDHVYITMTQSKDGYVWLGTSGTVLTGNAWNQQEEQYQSDGELTNYFVRLDPWTLDRKIVTLPAGITGTTSVFGAWQADAFHGSAYDNVLYWKSDHQHILRYDIDANKVDTVLDLVNMPLLPDVNAPWTLYGTAFAVNQKTGELIVTCGTYIVTCCVNDRNNWKILRVDPNGGQPRADEHGVIGNIISEHPLEKNYWFPAMPVFPDKYRPEFTSVPFPQAVTLSGTHPVDSLDLIDKVNDADNMRAAIVTTVLDGYNKSLVNAFIWRDTLVVAARKTIPAGQPAETTTLTLKFNSNGHVITKELDVTVQPGVATHPATGVTLDRTTAELTVGQTLTLTATVAPANATNKTVTWTSSAPAVASVNSAGVVMALSANGTAAVIIATTADGGFTAFCTVSTKAADPIVTNPFELNQHSLTLYPGQNITLALTAPQHFDVTWSSSVPSVATVGSGGVVHSVSAGTTTIIARDLAKGKVDICTVTVLPFPASTPESIELNTSFLNLIQGETATLRATSSSGLAGKPVIWSASNPNVADVTAGGMVITFAPGTCVIRATIGSWSATCTVQVSAPREKMEVDDVTTDGARLFIPKMTGASYYLLHLYTKQGVTLAPVYTLKVTPDGIVTLRSTAADNLVVPLVYLSPAPSYIVEAETIRELQGKADVIRTEMVAFTTSTITGIEEIFEAQPGVWYANGTLRIAHLDGYACTVTSVSGQHTHQFRVVSPDESHRIQLVPGVYVLTARKDGGDRKVFKFVVIQ